MGNGGDPAVAALDLLRFSTVGSVDDGKSTLIGRLLHDTKAIPEDQLGELHAASRRRGEHTLDLALLTDGLRAEREQKITIDVAYRYFATRRRKFIVADTPGHEQYTRNMVTGASTADLAILLLDASRGITAQSRRHGFITSLLRVPNVVLAVNKMDIVGWSRGAYDRIVDEYVRFAQKLELNLRAIPISALSGDNVVEPSRNMPWYEGGTLLHHLESVGVGSTRNMIDFRFPVQYVIRSDRSFRGYAGRVVSGTIAPGEPVVVLPSGRESTIRTVEGCSGPLREAGAPDSVVITLTDDLDVGRGDMIVRRRNLPSLGSRLDAIVCWLSEEPLDPGLSYVLSHTTREVGVAIEELVYRIDVNSLHRSPAATLRMNEVGRVRLETAAPLCFDSYRENRATGSFILIDPRTNATVAAGMIRAAEKSLQSLLSGDRGAVRPDPGGSRRSDRAVTREQREARNGHRAGIVWLTGLPASGKTTIAAMVERRLFESGIQTVLLDGDGLRQGLNGDLGFSDRDRAENVRRVGEVARLFFEQGSVVICALVSPFRRDRALVRSLFPDDRFVEVFVDCPVDECMRRDPKGLYRRALEGAIPDFTGVGGPYEAPVSPELVIRTAEVSPVEGADAVLRAVRPVVELQGGS